METLRTLALNGGRPVRSAYLPYGKQWLDEKDLEGVLKVLNSDYLTTGPMIGAFEKAIAEYVGAKYAVAFSSGTAALHGACHAAGIGAGDEVITTPITFAASANCVLYTNGTPVFADIDPETYNLDPDEVKEKINERTKAIIPVHFTGQSADMEPIWELARQHNLIVIEDAAHALGARYQGERIGGLSDMTMFSFHPVKHITTGEGGIITTNRQDLYEKLILFRSHGITRQPEKMQNHEGPWYYEMLDLGFNYRMTDIQAALGLSQLDKLSEFLTRRTEIAAIYNETFQRVPGLTVPYQSPKGESSWHLYVLRFDDNHFRVGRRILYEALLAENIGVNVHYIPVYYHPYYQQLGYNKGICPRAEQLYEEIITLPLFPAMTDEDVQDVIWAVEKVVAAYSVHAGSHLVQGGT